ncbi:MULTISPECIES: TolC family protein [unclassified Lebetimonas]|uniref:TolC family protein n=1 Tax=unclassified Lebetimonas TaxID=2648158 RepID=UPI0004650D36|nr:MULTISPECIES: TolC family protein [unclassified Lebetimonas]
MKKLSFGLILAISLNAANLNELFNAIKKTPDTKIDNLLTRQTKVIKKEITSSLYPNISLFASSEHFSSPTNIKPLPPTKSQEIGMQHGGYWFSQNIQKIGFIANMPIFVKSIYDTKDKISHLLIATKYKAKINLLKRESLLITVLSKYNYLIKLKNALNDEKNSIQTTLDAIKVGVNVGRIPAFNALRLKDALNQINIKISGLNMQIDEIISEIYQLTKIKLNKPLPIEIDSNINKQSFLALKPLKENLKASEYDVKTAKDSFWPKLMLQIKGFRAFANAYNNDEHLALNYASAGIYINWNIFNRKNSAEVQKAKIEKLKNALTIQKTIKDLNANVLKITSSLKEIKKSISLAQDSIEIREELLKGAKVAFKLNRMTVDDYLKYENNLALAKANLANLIATKNSLIANLAFIYGNNLERIFK